MTVFLVEGMTCQGCVKAVTNAIQTRLADAEISVELEDGKVSVNSDDSATVIEAIEDAGFDYKGTA